MHDGHSQPPSNVPDTPYLAVDLDILERNLSRAAADSSALTELRPGVYVFNDAQQVELGTCDFEDVALTAMATVVSRSGQQAIVDAGSKVLGADRAAWATGFGRLPEYPGARVVALSEHHATIRFPESEPVPERTPEVHEVFSSRVLRNSRSPLMPWWPPQRSSTV